MTFTRTSSLLLVVVAAMAAVSVPQAGAVSINVPNSSFESATVAPVQLSGTQSVNGWNIQFAGTPYPQVPYTNNYSVVAGALSQAASLGSNYLAFYPGEFYWGGNFTVPPPGQNLTNETLTLKTTGITDVTQAGKLYTASIDVGVPTGCGNNYSPAFSLSILDNGNQVATQTLPYGLTDQGTWHQLSVSYTALTSGDSLQIQLLADHFYEKGLTNPVYHNDGGVDPSDFFMEANAMVDNARLALGETPEPATLTLLVTGLIGFLAYAWRQRRA